MDVLWLSQKDVAGLGLTMAEIIEAVEQGFAAHGRGEVELPAKIGVHPRHDCFLHAMPCHVGGAVDRTGIKCVSGYPSNPAKGLPYINGVHCMFEASTGRVLAVMDCAWITAWRTGAASGVYAKYFAGPEAASVAIVGCGVQGRVNLLAMKEVLPNLREVRAYDPFPAQVERFAADLGPQLPKAAFTTCTTAREAVTGADVVITCTPIVEKPERFIPAAWLKDETLAIAVDYDAAFNADVFAAGPFVADDSRQYLETQALGVYFQNGYPGPGQVYAGLGEVVAGVKPAVRAGRRGAVLMGIALDDIMTAELVYRRAREKGVGRTVEL